jgi:hypothetical protein
MAFPLLYPVIQKKAFEHPGDGNGFQNMEFLILLGKMEGGKADRI